MKIHHFSAGTLCPRGGSLLGGQGGPWQRATLVCHCLLIETDRHGLVLVDSGLGTADLEAPAERLGRQFTAVAAPRLDRSTTALAFVERAGFRPSDVRHVLLTHLDLDHAGGISDFPEASIHVLADEHAAAEARITVAERNRYRTCQWAHGARFVLHEPSGEPWRGFASARALPGLPEELLMIPLSGHTRGHACIAVDAPTGALVHAGDAYFHRSSVRDPEDAGRPPALAVFETLVAVDRSRIRDNHRRLHELRAGGGVEVFCAHDPVELEEAQGQSGRSTGSKISATSSNNAGS